MIGTRFVVVGIKMLQVVRTCTPDQGAEYNSTVCYYTYCFFSFFFFFFLRMIVVAIERGRPSWASEQVWDCAAAYLLTYKRRRRYNFDDEEKEKKEEDGERRFAPWFSGGEIETSKN